MNKEVIVTTKIVYDLEETPFFIDIYNLRFYFSSKFQLDKFKRAYPQKVESMIYRIKPYIGDEILKFREDLKIATIIETYKKSEPRGCKYHFIENESNINYV